MAKVNELVIGIKCVGGKIEEDEIFSKVLRSLHLGYKHKVAAIDEIQSVTILTRDILVGKLVAFALSEFGESHGKLRLHLEHQHLYLVSKNMILMNVGYPNMKDKEEK